MLDEARSLEKSHPIRELEAIPEIREAPGLEADRPTEWMVDSTEHALLRRSVDLDQIKVVAVSHPLCHFSSAAMHDIHADPLLMQLFKRHAKWLAPQDGRFDLGVIERSNQQYPDQQTTLTFRREEWPMIDTWATPTFYLLENGVVKAKVGGWPREGRRHELLNGFRQVGVLR